MVKTYTVKEIEDILHVQGRAIRRYIASGELRASKIGNGYVVQEADLMEFLEKRKNK